MVTADAQKQTSAPTPNCMALLSSCCGYSVVIISLPSCHCHQPFVVMLLSSFHSLQSVAVTSVTKMHEPRQRNTPLAAALLLQSLVFIRALVCRQGIFTFSSDVLSSGEAPKVIFYAQMNINPKNSAFSTILSAKHLRRFL